MSFSSRRRNYLLTPHRRDGLIEWMKSMLQHSFVLDALETTGADTFSHFELLIDEHRKLAEESRREGLSATTNGTLTTGTSARINSRLQQLVPTIGVFHTHLPLRAAFEIYNEKHRLTKRKHIQISFNEIRHILNLAQIMAMRKAQPEELSNQYPNPFEASKSRLLVSSHALEDGDGNDSSASSQPSAVGSDDRGIEEVLSPPGQQLNGPQLISFDGDQTLYSDGQNFERNPRLANYLYQLLRHGVYVAVVTAAGYEYKVEKYEYRLSGLLHYFKSRGLTEDECGRFYLFGGECNYLLQLGSDYRLHPVRERGPGGWMTSTSHLSECPANWDEDEVQDLLNAAEAKLKLTCEELNLRGRVIRKRRSVGLVPTDGPGQEIARESLDEAVLRIHEDLQRLNNGRGPNLPYCAFNGGSDAWIDAGNKRVGVQVLQDYLGIPEKETLHIGDQFLNTGNDYAARDVSPCIWIINPQETTYILKSILRLAGVSVKVPDGPHTEEDATQLACGCLKGSCTCCDVERRPSAIDFQEMERRALAAQRMDVYTGEIVGKKPNKP